MVHRDSRVSHIKQAQKEALFFKEFSDLLMRIKADDSRLAGLMITRVRLSPDRKNLTIFLRADTDEQKYRELLQILILYKPSLRSALAKKIAARLTPDILFKYDRQFEKQQRIEQLLEQLGQDQGTE
jgi:ribosome-binding factor A